MLITINKVDYECLKFKPGNHYNYTIVVDGHFKSKENNIDIVYGDFKGFGYKMIPTYNKKTDSTLFLFYVYQPGDPELREIR